MLEQFRGKLEALQKQMEELQNQALPEVPDWTQTAMKASVAAGTIDTSEGGATISIEFLPCCIEEAQFSF